MWQDDDYTEADDVWRSFWNALTPDARKRLQRCPEIVGDAVKAIHDYGYTPASLAAFVTADKADLRNYGSAHKIMRGRLARAAGHMENQ